MLGSPLPCPKCGKTLPVDSVREFTDGRKRIYWECSECNVSIMDRGGSQEGKD
ncbi:MAG TPA: hypothetical protein VJA27_03095 [Patescibacteria group bacterium]|nr:hypothetical protein [Patescibacteria group bacterium]